MNATDHARARSLVNDLRTVQQILNHWADENQQLADENERLRADLAKKAPVMPKETSQTFLTPKELANRWGFHHESILRKLRQRELPSFVLNRRSIRVSMADVMAYEAENLIARRK